MISGNLYWQHKIISFLYLTYIYVMTKEIKNFLNSIDWIDKIMHHYNKTREEIIFELWKYASVQRYRNKNLKQIKIDFIDQESWVKLYKLERFI